MSTMYKIFAGNVPPTATEEQLREVFSPHIVIEDVVIATDPETGKPRGYGFVMTREAAKARAAMRKVGKVEINGRRVYFKEAIGKQSKKKPSSRPPRPHRVRPDRRQPGGGGAPYPSPDGPSIHDRPADSEPGDYTNSPRVRNEDSTNEG